MLSGNPFRGNTKKTKQFTHFNQPLFRGVNRRLYPFVMPQDNKHIPNVVPQDKEHSACMSAVGKPMQAAQGCGELLGPIHPA